MHLLFLVSSLLTLSLAHPDPTYYNTKCESLSNVTYYSFHIHCLFWPNNNDSVTAAFSLRKQFMEEFNINENQPCNDINNTHGQIPPLCMVDFDYPEPACPFLTTEWAAFVPVENFQETVNWIMLHHGDLDILIHPNSGCEMYDHRDWYLTLGNKWELDRSCLHYDCPGCDIYDCLDRAQIVLFKG